MSLNFRQWEYVEGFLTGVVVIYALTGVTSYFGINGAIALGVVALVVVYSRYKDLTERNQ